MFMRKIKRVTAQGALGLALALYASSSFAVVGKLQQFRCNEDPGPKGGAAQVQQRLNWAWKCYPDVMEVLDFQKNANENMWDFPGQGRVMAYPVFGVSLGGGNFTIMQAPIDENAACDVLQKQAPKQKITIVGFCGVGCLTGDQVVMFGEGLLPIGSSKAGQQASAVTLQEGASLQNLRFKNTPLQQIVTDLEPKKQNILHITTASGNSIKVTENHPLVDGQGVVRRADSLQVGESLVTAAGLPEPIASIEKSTIFGRVYNLRIDSSKIEENIYIAQGFLNGSVAIQNEYVELVNRKLLRLGDLLDLKGI